MYSVTMTLLRQLHGIAIKHRYVLCQSVQSIKHWNVVSVSKALAAKYNHTCIHNRRRLFSSDVSTQSDRILLNGCEFYGKHGYYDTERIQGQKFIVDAVIHYDCRQAGISDNIEHTINYGTIYKLIERIVTTEQYYLLEALCHNIAVNILSQYTYITQCDITVKKPHVAVTGHINYLGVTVHRTRSDLQLQPAPLHSVASNPLVADEHTAYQASDDVSDITVDDRDESDRFIDTWEHSINTKQETRDKLNALHHADEEIEQPSLYADNKSQYKHRHRNSHFKKTKPQR